MKKSILKITLLTALISVVVIGCKKEWDTPPIKTIPETGIITIAQLKAFYNDTTGGHRFIDSVKSDQLSVYAVVTMDETSGNLYKNIFVQDATGGIQLRLLSSGGLYQGDSVRIYLPGTSITTYQRMFQLDSVDTDRNVIKQETGQDIAPQEVSIDMINDSLKKYEGYLIKLTDVEFQLCEEYETYADNINQQSLDKFLLDCNGNNIAARTSGYADFAGELIPKRKGSLVGVVGNYKGTPQFLIRSVEEVGMTGLRCSGVTGDCSDPITSVNVTFDNAVDGENACQECWLNIAVKGNSYWQGAYDDYDWTPGTNVIEASGYGSSEPELEIWFISPPITFGTTDKLSFQSGVSYTYINDELSVWISEDFDGSNVSGASWSQIPASISGASAALVYSGTLYLEEYLSQNFSGEYNIGFKYEATPLTVETTAYRIDNIQITK